MVSDRIFMHFKPSPRCMRAGKRCMRAATKSVTGRGGRRDAEPFAESCRKIRCMAIADKISCLPYSPAFPFQSLPGSTRRMQNTCVHRRL